MPWRSRRRPGIVRRAAGLLKAHDLFMMGAGIAFFFTLALIPLVLLGTSALGFALGSPERATAQIFPAIRRIVPRATMGHFEGVVRSLVEGRAVAGWLGLISLLWVASGAYDAIAHALTTLSGLRETRSYVRRKLLAGGLMVATGALFLSTLILVSLATAIGQFGGQLLDEWFPGGMAWAHGVLLVFGPPAMVAATFLILYRWAPPQPLPWGPAAVGATLGGALWYLARRAFSWYMLRVARNDLVYGLLGSFIGLLLWIYYTSTIFLVGAVLALACWRNRPTPDRN